MTKTTTKYYQVTAVYEGTEEIMFGSFVRSNCTYELECEREGWKEQGYKKIKISSYDTEDKPDREVYTKEELDEQDEQDEQDIVITATFHNFIMLQCCLDKIVDFAMFDTLSVDKAGNKLMVGIKGLWIDETIEAMNRGNATSIKY